MFPLLGLKNPQHLGSTTSPKLTYKRRSTGTFNIALWRSTSVPEKQIVRVGAGNITLEGGKALQQFVCKPTAADQDDLLGLGKQFKLANQSVDRGTGPMLHKILLVF